MPDLRWDVMHRLGAAAVLFLCAHACTHTEPALQGQSQGQMIGPEGGTVIVGNVELRIPPGALAAPTAIEIREMGSVYVFEPVDLQLRMPAEVRFQSDAPEGLTVYWTRFDSPTRFEAVPSSVVGQRIVASVSHLGRGSLGVAPTVLSPSDCPPLPFDVSQIGDPDVRDIVQAVSSDSRAQEELTFSTFQPGGLEAPQLVHAFVNGVLVYEQLRIGTSAALAPGFSVSTSHIWRGLVGQENVYSVAGFVYGPVTLDIVACSTKLGGYIQRTITFTSLGGGPAIRVLPGDSPFADLGSVPIGTSTELELTIVNDLDRSVFVSGMRPQAFGERSRPFSFTGFVPQTLASGASMSFRARYAPILVTGGSLPEHEVRVEFDVQVDDAPIVVTKILRAQSSLNPELVQLADSGRYVRAGAFQVTDGSCLLNGALNITHSGSTMHLPDGTQLPTCYTVHVLDDLVWVQCLSDHVEARCNLNVASATRLEGSCVLNRGAQRCFNASTVFEFSQ